MGGNKREGEKVISSMSVYLMLGNRNSQILVLAFPNVDASKYDSYPRSSLTYNLLRHEKNVRNSHHRYLNRVRMRGAIDKLNPRNQLGFPIALFFKHHSQI